ncbi:MULTISPECIES: gamma-glutamylcyclotransferase family protein [Streptomycetaceae]|nr:MULTISPECIES: gamma-glutamylcyclotransferase family protein [Streptomycetaceae]MYS58590.1 gamma-glutamylcyclotransferase [Streptomyces sp. SID5468]
MDTSSSPVAEGRLPFFVYGTLRPGEVNHARLLRGRTARAVPAVLRGALLYDGPGYPYALDAPGTPDGIHGDLIEPLPEAYDDVLAELDRLEDHTPGAPDNLYERLARTVHTAAGPRDAWVYLAGRATARHLRAHGRRIPGGDWKRRS